MPENTDINLAALQQLAQVQGQLVTITQMIHQHHSATDKRIDDFRHAAETRFSGIEDRIGVLEANERGTAMRTAGFGALAGAIVSAGIALMRYSPLK